MTAACCLPIVSLAWPSACVVVQDLKRPENLKVEPDHKRLHVEAVGARCAVPRKRCEGAAQGDNSPVRFGGCIDIAVLLSGQFRRFEGASVPGE